MQMKNGLKKQIFKTLAVLSGPTWDRPDSYRDKHPLIIHYPLYQLLTVQSYSDIFLNSQDTFCFSFF